MSQDKYRPVELECTHMLWFVPTQMPQVGEWLWCKKCQKIQRAGNEEVTLGRVIEDEFWSEPIGKTKYKGGCLVCGHTVEEARNWYRLREAIHQHVMRTHTRFGSTLVINTAPIPRNTRPPF